MVPAMDMVIARMGLNFLDDFDQVLRSILSRHCSSVRFQTVPVVVTRFARLLALREDSR